MTGAEKIRRRVVFFAKQWYTISNPNQEGSRSRVVKNQHRGGAPRFETLPLYKIIRYPLEKRDYKPFAQARLCCNEESLFVRMWAFEALVIEGSALIAQLSLDRSERYLELVFTTGEPYALRLMEAGRLLRELPGDCCGCMNFAGRICRASIGAPPPSCRAACLPSSLR